MLTSKLFGFDPVEKTNFDMTKDLAIIPTDEKDKITYYLEIQMHQIANEILKEFEKKASNIPKRSSGLSDIEFSEYSLLSGSLLDAQNGFKMIVDTIGQSYYQVSISKQCLACVLYLQSTGNVFFRFFNILDHRTSHKLYY
jgi:hypothetical protein